MIAGRQIRLARRDEVDGGEAVVVVETLIGLVAIGAMTLVGVPLAHLRRSRADTPGPPR
ncbi:MAG: hypothetical protein ACRDGN_09070 [bacterium]